jgi:hypothetical protein
VRKPPEPLRQEPELERVGTLPVLVAGDVADNPVLASLGVLGALVESRGGLHVCAWPCARVVLLLVNLKGTPMLATVSHSDVSTLITVLVVVCLLVGVYFLVMREFVGAGVAVFVAFLIALLFA